MFSIWLFRVFAIVYFLYVVGFFIADVINKDWWFALIQFFFIPVAIWFIYRAWFK